MIRNGLPSIPKKLFTKIMNWEFVDLSELHPSSNPTEAILPFGLPSAGFSLFPGCNVVQHWKHRIANTRNRDLTFVAFAAAIILQHPSASLKLLAYMTTILKASQQYEGFTWRACNTHYRMKVAASRNRQWSQLDTDQFTGSLLGEPAHFPLAASVVASHTPSRPVLRPHVSCPVSPSGREGASGQQGGASKTLQLARWPASISADYNDNGSCSFDPLCNFCHVWILPQRAPCEVLPI